MGVLHTACIPCEYRENTARRPREDRENTAGIPSEHRRNTVGKAREERGKVAGGGGPMVQGSWKLPAPLLPCLSLIPNP